MITSVISQRSMFLHDVSFGLGLKIKPVSPLGPETLYFKQTAHNIINTVTCIRVTLNDYDSGMELK